MIGLGLLHGEEHCDVISTADLFGVTGWPFVPLQSVMDASMGCQDILGKLYTECNSKRTPWESSAKTAEVQVSAQ